MSMFYPGQRVRIVGASRYKHLIGREATTTARHECALFGSGWRVSIDGTGEGREDGHFHWFLDGHLESIAPEGMESNEEIDALYEPQPVRSVREHRDAPGEWGMNGPDKVHQSKLLPEDNKFHVGNGGDGKHYWLVPPDLYAELDAQYHFDFDPCPFPKPDDFDGLTAPWGQSNYVNPPFGSIIHQGRKKGATAWVRKLISEWQEHGRASVMHFPVDKWVLMLIGAGAKVYNDGDVRWLATEDGTPGKGTGRHIARFVLGYDKPAIDWREWFIRERAHSYALSCDDLTPAEARHWAEEEALSIERGQVRP